jgi:hypothetical protein
MRGGTISRTHRPSQETAPSNVAPQCCRPPQFDDRRSYERGAGAPGGSRARGDRPGGSALADRHGARRIGGGHRGVHGHGHRPSRRRPARLDVHLRTAAPRGRRDRHVLHRVAVVARAVLALGGGVRRRRGVGCSAGGPGRRQRHRRPGQGSHHALAEQRAPRGIVRRDGRGRHRPRPSRPPSRADRAGRHLDGAGRPRSRSGSGS